PAPTFHELRKVVGTRKPMISSTASLFDGPGSSSPLVVQERSNRRHCCHRLAATASAGLFHPHVPFDEPADLALGITALHHPRDKIAVLLFGVAVLLRPER